MIPRLLALGIEIRNCRKRHTWGRLGYLGGELNNITLKDLLNISV